MKPSTPIEVRVTHKGAKARRELYAHVHQCCSSHTNGKRVVMPAMKYAKLDFGCTDCQASIADALSESVQFDNYKNEVASAFGRSPVEILKQDGFVEPAVEKFSSKDATIAAGLAQAPLGRVFDVVCGRNCRIKPFCIECGNQISRVGQYPTVQKVEAQCGECGHTHFYHLDDYVPDFERAQQALDSIGDHSYKKKRVTKQTHDFSDVVVEQAGDEFDITAYFSEEGIIFHGGDVQCGAQIGGQEMTVYEVEEDDFCGNCQRAGAI